MAAGRPALELFGKEDVGLEDDVPGYRFDEDVWVDHIDALLAEMDGTTADQFAAAVSDDKCSVLVGLAKLHRHCRSRVARTKCLEGIMSVCAVVPDGYLPIIASPLCPGAVGEVVKDACRQSGDPSDTVGQGDAEAAAMHDLYAVVLLGQLAEFLFDRADRAVSLAGVIMQQQDNGGGCSDAGVASRNEVGKVLDLQMVPGLLARLDSDSSEMVLAASTALVTLNALSWWSRSAASGWFWSQARGHRNLRFMGETVLQLLNRSASASEARRLLLMTLELLEGGGGDILYSNDIRVLVDVCIRGLAEEGVENAGEEAASGGESEVQDYDLRVNCRWLCVKVLEQVILRPEFSSDVAVCKQVSQVLERLLDSSGDPSPVSKEADRVLSKHIAILDPLDPE